MHQTDHSSDYERSARQRFQKRCTQTQAQLSPTRTQNRGTSTVPCSAIKRSARSAPLNRVQSYCEHSSLPMLSADGRDWKPRQHGGERSKCLRSSLSCKASAATLRACASFASPLRLSGESPDSRRGGAVIFNPSRRTGREARRTREPRHEPLPSLNARFRWGACGGSVLLGLGIFAQSVLTRW